MPIWGSSPPSPAFAIPR